MSMYIYDVFPHQISRNQLQWLISDRHHIKSQTRFSQGRHSVISHSADILDPPQGSILCFPQPASNCVMLLMLPPQVRALKQMKNSVVFTSNGTALVPTFREIHSADSAVKMEDTQRHTGRLATLWTCGARIWEGTQVNESGQTAWRRSDYPLNVY
jgi:hypothetical protein